MHTSTFRALPHRTAAIVALGLASGLASAAEINTLNLLNQAEFKGLSEDMGAALSFKPLIPAESMGITGFDVGLAVTATTLKNRDVWIKAAGGADIPATLPVPTLRVHKGLPFDIDIGASYAAVPTTGISVIGGELRWAALSGSTLTPAIALRLSASAMTGVDQLKVRTTGFDVSVSKGFTLLTPYAGIGTVNVKTTPSGAPALKGETLNLAKVFIGANINLGLMNIAIEGDKTGKANSYGLKLGVRF
jgi:hypothetical protein